MSERQMHGLSFEDWFRDTFTNNNSAASATGKWDISNPTYKGEFTAHVSAFQGLPVFIKTCKYGTSINFGDALRQFNNTEDFLLIVGFWIRAGNAKKFVSVKAKKVTHKVWHQLFAKVVTPDELKNDRMETADIKIKLEKLDTTIKKTPSFQEARRKAQEEKKTLPPMEIVINPKIDSKNRRRLQCSLPFQTFWEKIAVEPSFQYEKCTFWGVEVPMLL